MAYLFFQIWLWIIASFALGWFAHWFLCCREKDTDEANSDLTLKSPSPPEHAQTE